MGDEMGFTYLGGVITQTGTDKMTVPELGERVVPIDNLVKSVTETLKENEMKDDDILTATEVSERAEAFFSDIREKDIAGWYKSREEIAAIVADPLLEAFGADLPAAQLEQLLAIREGNES